MKDACGEHDEEVQAVCDESSALVAGRSVSRRDGEVVGTTNEVTK